jgi:hypothetical protein
MKTTVRKELISYIEDLINDGVLTEENQDDWHFHAFNEDYYIIGYWNAEQWLKHHNISPFEAIKEVKQYEEDNFGEMTTKVNPESIVNMLAYIYGEELIYSAETIEELKTLV